MKILVIADMHGNYKKLEEITEKIKEDFDLVICPGDFTDMFSLTGEFSQLDIANLVLQKLIALNKPLFCVPGNHDPYEILDILSEYNVNLHAKKKEFQGFKFIGFGGAATPFNTIFEPSEGEIAANLKALSKDLKPGFILIVHNPPKDTKLDKTTSGAHVGSKAIRDFILQKKPLLAITAHIHEASGEDKLGNTTLFYPGPAYDGYYGIVEIEGKKVSCEIKKID